MHQRIDSQGEFEAATEGETSEIPDDRETVRALPNFDEDRRDDVTRDDLASDRIDDTVSAEDVSSAKAKDSSASNAEAEEGSSSDDVTGPFTGLGKIPWLNRHCPSCRVRRRMELDDRHAVRPMRVKIETRSLYELRTDAGLSQQQVADDMGCSQSQVSRLEGRVRFDHVHVRTIRRYLRAIGHDVQLLWKTTSNHYDAPRAYVLREEPDMGVPDWAHY